MGDVLLRIPYFASEGLLLEQGYGIMRLSIHLLPKGI